MRPKAKTVQTCYVQSSFVPSIQDNPIRLTIDKYLIIRKIYADRNIFFIKKHEIQRNRVVSNRGQIQGHNPVCTRVYVPLGWDPSAINRSKQCCLFQKFIVKLEYR